MCCPIVINIAAPKGHVRAVVVEMVDVMDETFDVGCTVETILQGALEMLARKVGGSVEAGVDNRVVRRLVASLVVVPTCVQAHGYIGCILHGSDDVRVVLDGRLHDGADVVAVVR